MTDFPNGLPDDAIRPIPRPNNGEGFYLVMKGGLRASKLEPNQWLIEPLHSENEAVASGIYSDTQLNAFVRLAGLGFLGYHSFGWYDGQYHSSWSPYIYGEKNNFRGPADLWSSIASNLLSSRLDANKFFETQPTEAEIAAFKDDRTPEEHLALQISSSLRNLDISIEQIADFYAERLTNGIYAGVVVGQKSAQSDDQKLYAHIHAFLLQIGSARDYLAALIAQRMGKDPKRVDSMNKLRLSLKGSTTASNSLLALFVERGLLIAPHSESEDWQMGGWLRDLTQLRNELVHRRSYGSKYQESMGWIERRAFPLEVFRYVRPIVLGSGEIPDALDVLGYYYNHFQKLLLDCAKATGLDSQMLTITDADIIEIK